MATQCDKLSLRFADQEECRLDGMEPEVALATYISRSTRAFRVDYEDTTLAYWGWKDDGLCAASCQAWMLSTPEIESRPTFAARRSREFLDHLFTTHALVWIVVDPDYSLSIRWLKWLGFTVDGHNGPFLQMSALRGSRA